MSRCIPNNDVSQIHVAAGIVPDDIIYDNDAAHLLHSFIACATNPVFFTTLPMNGGLDDLIGVW